MVLFVPVDGRRRIEALGEALLELVEVCLQHVLERHVQRRRRLGEVPRHVAQLTHEVRPVELMPMASPASPHRPITLLMSTSFFPSAGLSVRIACRW